MACSLYSAKPLPRPMVTSFQFDPREQTSMETESKSYFFIHENLFEYVVY